VEVCAVRSEPFKPRFCLSDDFVLKAICSGKHTISEYLTRKKGFTPIHLLHNEGETGGPLKPRPEDQHVFDSVDELLEFVTKKWQENWVLDDITNEHALESLARRPFFLLVSVDAPVLLRWNRLKER
jgi:dCMP deaminase